MLICEAEERRVENMRRNGEVLASFGFEPMRRSVVVNTSRRGIKLSTHLNVNELTHLHSNS